MASLFQPNLSSLENQEGLLGLSHGLYPLLFIYANIYRPLEFKGLPISELLRKMIAHLSFPADRKDRLKHKDRGYFFSDHMHLWVGLIIVKHTKSIGNKNTKVLSLMCSEVSEFFIISV